MRTETSTRRGVVMLSAMALATGLAVFSAPPAAADENDEAFLEALQRSGIAAIGDPAGVVGWAHWACDHLDQGADPRDVVSWLDQYNGSSNPAFDASDARFLRAAAIYYCPAHKDAAFRMVARSG